MLNRCLLCLQHKDGILSDHYSVSKYLQHSCLASIFFSSIRYQMKQFEQLKETLKQAGCVKKVVNYSCSVIRSQSLNLL